MQSTGPRPFLALAAVGVLAFAAGYLVRGAGPVDLTIYTGDGYVGDSQASFTVGATSYGFGSSVPWRDESGSERFQGWPSCLPMLSTVTGIRFAGAVVMHEGVGQGRVLWVDCKR